MTMRLLPHITASLALLAAAGVVHAADSITFVPLTRVSEVNYQDLGAYLNSLFRLAVIAAAILAVNYITIGGFEYITSEAIGDKKKGREQIIAAITGLLLLLSSYLILKVINPQLLTLDIRYSPEAVTNPTAPQERFPNTTNSEIPGGATQSEVLQNRQSDYAQKSQECGGSQNVRISCPDPGTYGSCDSSNVVMTCVNRQ